VKKSASHCWSVRTGESIAVIAVIAVIARDRKPRVLITFHTIPWSYALTRSRRSRAIAARTAIPPICFPQAVCSKVIDDKRYIRRRMGVSSCAVPFSKKYSTKLAMSRIT